MTANVLDLQRLPTMTAFGFSPTGDEGIAESCSLCTNTCAVTASPAE